MSTATELHELGNGRYSVRLNEAGAGQSLWNGIALSRWCGDPVQDADGFFIYLRDTASGELWSAGMRPTGRQPQRYEAQCLPDRVVIEREDLGIASSLQISVADAGDVETRCLRLHNRSDRVRRIEVTSYIELALAPQMADLSHPAFSKLFVQTERVEACGVLLAVRRPRGAGESWPVLAHALSGAPVQQWETDRLGFVGRGRSPANPALTMSGSVGNVLDPIFSLRTSLVLAPGESRELSFLLGAAADRSKLLESIGQNAIGPAPAPSPAEPPRRNAIPRSEFSADGSEYLIHLPWNGAGLDLPPMPWVNIIANERLGFTVSETGAGCTWARNSQANRLTPWSNDPICDPHGEALYIRDEGSGAYWSPLPGPVPPPVQHEVRHGFGYSSFASVSHQLEQSLTMFAAKRDPVKIVRLRLKNSGAHARRLSVFAFQQLVMRDLAQFPSAVRTWQRERVLCAQNDAAGDFAGGIAFSFAVAGEPAAESLSESVCCDRRAFIGVGRSARSPLALSQPLLDGACGANLDPCFARQLQFTLPPGQAIECSFVLGEAVGEDELIGLIARYRDAAAIEAAYAEAIGFWKESLGAIQVRTPSAEIDRMVNGWLPYQALSCRIWGRTAFYQSGGAFGFRDQLQDAGNVCLLWPELTRRQILLHARHQFVEGDVLHWWHPEPLARGLRTRFSDDLVWLPHVACRYIRETGDVALFDETLPFQSAPLLQPGQDENYLKPDLSVEQATLYQHCCRALDRSLTRGAHGLPLMGTGDWNDGMNRVGREGRGDSVWLGFFLCRTLADFVPLAQQRGDAARVERYSEYRLKLVAALNDAGWDGAWYRRAYYDDGTPLGTAGAAECRIDGLAQAWSVLSDVAPDERARQAMDSLEAHLVSEADGLIRLLTPPFVNTPEDPGYIKGYVAGVRENGGQYTHAACWMVAALAKLGRRERAALLLAMLSPLRHSRSPDAIERYKVEPYVIAADVYGAEPHVGRGGWTWYTGSAGVAYSVAMESVLGLSVEHGDTLVLRPCVPDDWAGYRIDYRRPGSHTRYLIEVRRSGERNECVVGVELDGSAVALTAGAARLPMVDDGALHRVLLTLGSAAA
jgi:cyclic beta-1,2-glucan synthetase